MNIATIGVDPAKNVFQLHGVTRSVRRCYQNLEACRRDEFLRQDFAVPDRDGSMRKCASLGTQAPGLGHTVQLMRRSSSSLT